MGSGALLEEVGFGTCLFWGLKQYRVLSSHPCQRQAMYRGIKSHPKYDRSQ